MGALLITDLYELRMAASYLRHGMEGLATFSLFVRKLPPGRGFLVAAGLDDCLSFLERCAVDRHDRAYMRRIPGFTPADTRALAHLGFTGDVWAVAEGTLVFQNEPLLEVSAPIAEAQIVETYLLNQITFQTAIASKAARCRLAARGRSLVDFAFRRTHGVEAAMAVARASAIAGFAATSNVAAARRFGLTLSGTMAHSYVEAFAQEDLAFAAFVEDFPEHPTFLVDTYDTENGVTQAIRVAQDHGLGDAFSVRLDSGDIAVLSRRVRRLLDDAGCPGTHIFVSGGLDEDDVDSLVRGGAPVDVASGGTAVILEFRLHPVSGYRPPAGCSHYDIWEAVVTQLSQRTDAQNLRLGNEARPLSGMWDGLEAFPAYGDEIEPARLATLATAALALPPDRTGLVDHEAIGDAWERANGKVSIVALLIDQLTS